MTRWLLLAAGISAYLLFMLATVPATLLDTLLQRASDGRVRLADARGTVWSGAGHLETRDTRRQTGIARKLGWDCAPASLLRGHLSCTLDLEGSPRRFPVRFFPARIEIANADISVPAAMLGIALPKLAPFGPGGDLQLRIADLAIGQGGVRGNADLQWRGASSLHTAVSPLGNYEMRFEPAATGMTATLSTLDGPLQLAGSGAWANGARPVFQATARIAPQQREQLEPFLRMIAVERGAGNFELQLK